MAGGSKMTKLISLALMGLMFVFWILFLAGTAAQHDRCVKVTKDGINGNTNAFNTNTNTAINTNDILNQIMNGRKLLSHGRQLLGKAEDACRNQFSFTWWVVWFDFIILGLIIGTALVPMLKPFHGVTTTFVAMVSVLLMGLAYDNDSFVFNNKDNKNTEVEKQVSATRAAEAGIVGLLICNFVYLLLPAVLEAFGGLLPAGQSKDAAPKAAELTTPTASGPEVYYLPPDAESSPAPEDTPSAPAPATPPTARA